MVELEAAPALKLLAVGAHADDADLFAGATLALLAARGLRVGILDLTRGESATRGSPEQRAAEARAASEILGLTERVTLDLGDGRFENSERARREVVGELRRLRPAVVMTHFGFDRHPDHARAHDLVRDSCFFAGVGGFDAEGKRHRVDEIVYFVGHESAEQRRPDWIVDVSETFDVKMRAVHAFATQFYSPQADPALPETYIASEAFAGTIESTSRRWGHFIGADHGEAFFFERPAHRGHAFVELLAGGEGR